MINPTSMTALQTFLFIANTSSLQNPRLGAPLFVPLVGILASNNEYGDFSTVRRRTLPVESLFVARLRLERDQVPANGVDAMCAHHLSDSCGAGGRSLRKLWFLALPHVEGFGRTATSPSALSKNATTSGSTRPRPRRPSHEVAFSARLRGASFKSALPGREIGSRTWSGAGRGVSDETKLELDSVDRRDAGFPRSD